ncbi:MAG: hypothetical protein LUC44_06050 [Prevotellaceae bacterium]|nr:hypothetical protein [Prevotellaceae bacterium]
MIYVVIGLVFILVMLALVLTALCCVEDKLVTLTNHVDTKLSDMGQNLTTIKSKINYLEAIYKTLTMISNRRREESVDSMNAKEKQAKLADLRRSLSEHDKYFADPEYPRCGGNIYAIESRVGGLVARNTFIRDAVIETIEKLEKEIQE